MGSGQTYAGNETRENDQPLQESQECQEYVAVRTYLEMIIENDHGVLYTVCSHSVGIVIRMFLVMLLDNYYSLKEIIIIIKKKNSVATMRGGAALFGLSKSPS